MRTSMKQKRNTDDEEEQKPHKRVSCRKSHCLKRYCNCFQELTIEARRAIDYAIKILGHEQAAFLLERILYAAAGEGGDPAFSRHKLPFSFLSSTTSTISTTVKNPSTKAVLPSVHVLSSLPPTTMMPALKIIPPVECSQILLPSPTSVTDHFIATPPATTATATTSPKVDSRLMELAGAACKMRELELCKLNELKPVTI